MRTAKEKVSSPQVVTTSEVAGVAAASLREEIEDALGELVGAAREGLLALRRSVSV